VKRRSFLTLTGAAGAAGVAGVAAALPGLAAPAAASTARAAARTAGAANGSLRDLAARINMRIGTAVIPFDLDNAPYAKVLAEQFSVVTPGNEMKWGVVEPTQGQFDWSGADRLVSFAQAHGQLVRGHTLLWHNQLPTWLTDGVTNGSISSSQLRDLLKQHIFTEAGRFRGKIWQ